MEDFKGNSNASKNASAMSEKRVIAPVTTNVTEKKHTGFGKIRKRMFSEDAGAVGESVVSDVIIPKIQSLIVDACKYMIDFVFYGKSGANNPNKRSGIGTISYSNYYKGSGTTTIQQVPLSAYQSTNTVYQVKDIVFNERSEADDVILSLMGILNRYGTATVSDFYDLIGQHGSYTDEKWGWRDLSQTESVRCGSGWRIDFPKIIPLTK